MQQLQMVASGPFLDPTKVPLSSPQSHPAQITAFFMFINWKCQGPQSAVTNIGMLCSDGLVRRFIRDEKGVHFDKPSPSYDQKDFVPIEVKVGSLVVIHGDLIHQR